MFHLPVLVVLTYHDVVLPCGVVGELDPRADGVEVILGEHNTAPEPDDVVVTGNEVDTLVVDLTETNNLQIIFFSKELLNFKSL